MNETIAAIREISREEHAAGTTGPAFDSGGPLRRRLQLLLPRSACSHSSIYMKEAGRKSSSTRPKPFWSRATPEQVQQPAPGAPIQWLRQTGKLPMIRFGGREFFVCSPPSGKRSSRRIWALPMSTQRCQICRCKGGVPESG